MDLSKIITALSDEYVTVNLIADQHHAGPIDDRKVQKRIALVVRDSAASRHARFCGCGETMGDAINNLVSEVKRISKIKDSRGRQIAECFLAACGDDPGDA